MCIGNICQKQSSTWVLSRGQKYKLRWVHLSLLKAQPPSPVKMKADIWWKELPNMKTCERAKFTWPCCCCICSAQTPVSERSMWESGSSSKTTRLPWFRDCYLDFSLKFGIWTDMLDPSSPLRSELNSKLYPKKIKSSLLVNYLLIQSFVPFWVSISSRPF